jgi:hypothetical protein
MAKKSSSQTTFIQEEKTARASDDALAHLRRPLTKEDIDKVRHIEGFPIGTDEDIIALSDAPYYTACPNPFLQDFIRAYGKPYDEATDTYHREPFAADTGSGKTHPIYTAHSYHSKIPHLAIMPSILHYTEPGDIVLDGFAGSGMTGVATQLCGSPEEEFKHQLEQEWELTHHSAPRWGTRNALLIDLSPVASFIAYNVNCSMDAHEFDHASKDFFRHIEKELGWMYETLHSDGKTKGRINYVVWSEVLTCSNCGGEIVFVKEAYDKKTKNFKEEFPCPHCKARHSGRTLERKLTTVFDAVTGETIQRSTYAPIEIDYSIPGSKVKYKKPLDSYDKALLQRIEQTAPSDWVPTAKLPIGKMRDSNHLAQRGITQFHRFFLPRSLHSLSTMWRLANNWQDIRVRNFLKFMVEQCFWTMGLLNRYRPTGYSMTNQYLNGMYYIPVAISEISPWYVLEGKRERLLKLLVESQLPKSRHFLISTASSLDTPIPDNSIDYIYTDPPFGDAVKYGDLNLLVESWHRLFSHLEAEVLWDELKQKDLSVYSEMMRDSFRMYYKALKPGRWMTVVFHNSKNFVWNVIQEAIGQAGFIVADVRTLDREQGSFNQVTAAGAVKQDLVISSYKPRASFEQRFLQEAGTDQGAWDFTRQHLSHLPVFVGKGDTVEIVAERQNYLLFDRMVAFHIQRGASVPLSAAEFYAGLRQRFPERDGMYFTSDQVAEYDTQRAQAVKVEQLALFVSDEKSAVQWLRVQLEKESQTYQDIQPKFLRELHQARHEQLPELNQLLEENFLKDKQDRWYVPDPAHAGDLEKLRERGLLREFESYVASKGKLKTFRTEAVRAGFKSAWAEHTYATIIEVARRLPDDVLQEDAALLMYYDNAVMRVGP